jgi:hypothetical protein
MDEHQEVRFTGVRDLCSRFDVEFNLSTDKDLGIIYYHFGSITWQVPVGKKFDEKALYEISLQLAATYPEKILWKK